MSQKQRNKAIREARRNRQERQEQGSAAEEARAAISSSGASVGGSLGEHVAPPAPPQPGEAPGGGDARAVGLGDVPPSEAYVGGKAPLPDDYHAVMQQEGLSHVANPNYHDAQGRGVPAPHAPPSGEDVPIRKGMPIKEEHPILGALRRDFGLDSVPTEDVFIDGHKWTLGLLDAREMGLITRIADEFASTLSEREMTANCAVAAVATRAVDDVPIYEVFGVDLPLGVQIENKLQPPRSVRNAGAFKLFEFLTEESKNKLAYTLFEAYADKLDDKDQVQSYLNDEDKPRFRYKSPKASYEFVDFPNYDNEGKELPYYCRYSGATMQKVARVVGGTESPL